MYISIVKNTIIYLLSFYIYGQITRLESSTRIYKSLSLVFSVLLGIATFALKMYAPELSYFIPALSFALIVVIYSGTPSETHFSRAFVLMCINLLAFGILALASTMIIIPLIGECSENLIGYLTIFDTVLYSIFIVFLFKTTHTRKRLYNSTFTHFINVGILLSFITILIFSMIQVLSSKHFGFFYGCTLITPLLFLLITLWWRSQITKSYREKLRILEMETLRATQREQAQYISQLEEDNQRMGRIIHKDNRIVTAMADSVAEFLQNAGGLTAPEEIAKGQALAEQILEIQKDRQALLAAKAPSPTAIPPTGQVGIDALIAYMAKEASLHHITLQFHFHPDFFGQGKLDILENDMVHLLSDLLENAIVATRHAKGHNIELSMHKIKGTPTIAISDSGIPFEANTYMNLGIQPASTHLDDGGSGIGLMDIWALKEKYKATLYIEELPEGKDFTKRILFLFDRKNRYVVSTARWKELQKLQSRTDLLLMGPSTQIETK